MLPNRSELIKIYPKSFHIIQNAGSAVGKITHENESYDSSAFSYFSTPMNSVILFLRS
jgi:hypothetical protein